MQKKHYSEFRIGNIAINNTIGRPVEIVDIKDSNFRAIPIVDFYKNYRFVSNQDPFFSYRDEFEGKPLTIDELTVEGFEPMNGMENMWLKVTYDKRGFPVEILRKSNGRLLLKDCYNNTHIEFVHELQNSFFDYSEDNGYQKTLEFE